MAYENIADLSQEDYNTCAEAVSQAIGYPFEETDDADGTYIVSVEDYNTGNIILEA